MAPHSLPVCPSGWGSLRDVTPWAGVVSGPHRGSRGSTLPKRTGRGSEPGLALPTREGAGSLQLPGEEGDRSQDVWQWMLETERQSKPKPHR